MPVGAEPRVELSGPSPDGSRRWFLPLVLGAIALALRLGYWLGFTAQRRLTSDAYQYNALAANIAHGKGYVDVYPQLALHATAFRPPLYPALLGGIYAAVGVHPGVGRFVNVLLGMGVVVLTYFLVKRFVSLAAGIVAAAAVAVSPNLIANDTFTLSEPLGTLLLIGAVWALLSRRWFAAGVATGALILTRPSAQFLLPVLAVWIIVAANWRGALRYAAVAVLIITPWLVRNWVELGAPVLATSNGYNWAAMYSPPAQAAGHDIDPIADPYFAFMRLDQFDELRWDRHLERIGQQNLRRHPGLATRVAARNAVAFFEVRPSHNTAAERSDGRSLPVRSATLWIFYLTLGLGLAGLWFGRANRLSRLAGLVAVYFTAASLFFVAPPRLRAPVDLVLAIGAGILVNAVRQRTALTRRRRALDG